MSALLNPSRLYAHTDHALWRIFAQQERGTGAHPIGQLMQNGYRLSDVCSADGCTQEMRLADDSRVRERLRQALTQAEFSVLVLRYSPDLSDIQRHWPEVAHGFRRDPQLAKTLRSNPVLLRLLMVWSLRHSELRKHQLSLKEASRSTQHRWMTACARVADDAWSSAEQIVGRRLNEWQLLGQGE